MIFLKIGNKKYQWNGDTINSSIVDNDTESIQIGLSTNSFDLFLEYKLLKAVFFDLGNTLVKPILNGSSITDIIFYPETNEIISSLKDRGIKLGIISNGSRNLLSQWLNDQNSKLSQLFSKFDVVIMSDDDDIGIRKPHKQIFEKAISKLDPNLDPSTTAFITEQINDFKVYNLLFIQQLNEISSYI